MREAKVHTAWLKPDSEYESAYLAFIDAILKPNSDNLFWTDFISFQKKIAYFGIFNSLSQILLKLTAPGIPDFYQGTELWDLNLVDPDNRRPVDFKIRDAHLKYIEQRQNDLTALTKELMAAKEDGRIKLFLIYQALKARKKSQSLFIWIHTLSLWKL